MVVKVSSLRLSRGIFKRVHLNACLSSISFANNIQINPEIDQTPLTSSEFEANIQFLKNKLQPQSLVRVLDSTIDLSSSLKLFKWASLQKQYQHTADTYYQIILKLGMSGMVDEMEGFCNEMVKDRCPGSEEALLGLIDAFVRYRRLNEALRVLFVLNSSSYKPSIALINVLLGALVEEKKDFQSVLFVYKEMVKAGIVPTVDTLNYLLEALFEADRVDTALDQYRRMRNKGSCPNSRTYEIIIRGLINKNLVDESIVVLDEILDIWCELELNFYSSIIPLFCSMNKPEVGLRLFKKMRASKIVPDSLTYEVLIEYLSENLWLDDAIILLDEMIDTNLKPPDHVFANLINGFCMLDKFSEAKKFLEDRQVMETNSYNALLKSFCRAGNFLEAIGLFDKLFEKNIADSVSWDILIRFLSENGRSDLAFQYLGRMIISSCIPDSAIYSALIVGKCKSSELEDALEIFYQVRNKCWVLDSSSYATLVECLCQVEKIQEAAKVFCCMSSSRCTLQSSSFDILIKGLCLIGKVDKAITLLPFAYYSGTSCSNATYNSIMMGLSKLRKGNGLLVIVSRMVVEGFFLDKEAYNILIRSMAALNRTKDCALFLNLMVNEGLLPDSETLVNLLSCLAKHFQLHLIFATIDKLFPEHEVLNPAMCNTLISGLWKEGYRNEACRLLDMMLEKAWVPDATTHKLLIGSAAIDEKESEPFSSEKLNMQDEVSNILVEGFGDTTY